MNACTVHDVLDEGLRLCVETGCAPSEAAEKILAENNLAPDVRDVFLRDGLAQRIGNVLGGSRRFPFDAEPVREFGQNVGAEGEPRSGRYQLPTRADEGAAYAYLSRVCYQGADGSVKSLLDFDAEDWAHLEGIARERRKGYAKVERLAKAGREACVKAAVPTARLPVEVLDGLEAAAARTFGRAGR